ncbi:hypothetical protein P8C59_003306 [Phyllachora maydis]|uniref:Autophagy-related protein 11 n=1 Tax=Phyllachora maydis TaxID=1825666 RepID=A0AAD9I1K7_9PEZI|nr:hypothetical protein P8C59_003306 [Phyllachora maydis]
MATQVLIAHTGQRLELDGSQLNSLDDFKASVARQSAIPAQCIITLTPQGRALKFQAIQAEKEIYVYDNRITQATSPGTSPPPRVELPLPKRYNAPQIPDYVRDTQSIGSWQDLFKARRAWALQVVKDCEGMANASHERYLEMDVMLRCLDAAVANVETVVKALEPKYAEFRSRRRAHGAPAPYHSTTGLGIGRDATQTVKSQINGVSQEDEMNTFDYLRLIQQAPYLYASFLAEAVRRREWYEKVTQDSSTLANEMALFQDEEIKRRRRWFKSVGDAYGSDRLSDANAPGLEVNVMSEDDQWPPVNKKDLEKLLETLQSQKADAHIVADVGKLIADLNNPTKQQSKRMKAFRNGSVHEAALGRSGLLIRGDDDLLRALREDKVKMESKLRTAESRVRRLEDLLHRQSQASRLSIGNMFQPPSQHLADRNHSTVAGKPPRVPDERRASPDGSDSLVQRIQQLETELTAERERSAVFEKDLSTRTTAHNEIMGQMEEVNSTKKDLMGNMEALKREFVEERKSLEDEIKQLRARLEDTEEEMEHFGEARENEKASYEDKVLRLEREVDRLTKATQDGALKTEGQVEFLRNEVRLQREQAETQESRLQSAREEISNLTRELDRSEKSAGALLKAVRDLHQHLFPGCAAPDDTVDLVDKVVNEATSSLGRVADWQRDLALAKSDLHRSQGAFQALQVELSSVKELLSEERSSDTRLRESLAGEQARVVALEDELRDKREQLDQLRRQMADGETGSESLRSKLAEEEARVASMTEDLALRQSRAGSLEEELRLVSGRLQESQAKLAKVTQHFESRAERTRDVTQRLFAQNDRLTRLLERLGLSMIRQGDSMMIQKIPRSERLPQHANGPDPSISLRCSGTSGSQAGLERKDVEMLYWMDSADMDAEAEKYEAFLAALGALDMDAFTDAIYKRVKDVEHTARKLQREARAYRDKAHVLQKEAHDKVAYKQFKEGDLALFLPTRNQTTGAWAAFNVAAPHYFLREQESHKLRDRDWLLARITRMQERVVDLKKSLHQQPRHSSKKDDGASLNTNESGSLYDEENDNPFDLSDGLRWYLIDAHEEKTFAPSTPGLGKSTVAANHVEAKGDMHTRGRAAPKTGILGGRTGVPSAIEGVSKTLSKSLESRRSSTGSRKALPFAIGVSRGRDSVLASETNSLRAAAPDTPVASSPTQQQHAVAQSTHGGGAGSKGDGNAAPEEPYSQRQAPSAEARNRKTPRARNSAASANSRSRTGVVWDSLWSIDYSIMGVSPGK